MRLDKQKWNAAESGPLDLAAIRALHQPAGHFRVSPNRYPAGAEFPVLSRAGRLYVLGGACALTVGETSCELRAGDYVNFPEGQHAFHTVGDDAVEIVRVWELPREFWRESD